MTYFAGIYRLRQEMPRFHELDTRLVSAFPISGSVPDTFQTERLLAASVDLGIFQDSIETGSDGSLGFVSGDPLFDGGGVSRKIQTKSLLRGIRHDAEGALRRCQGAFAVMEYDEQEEVLVIATDKLGCRPVYVWNNRDYLVFSNLLQVMESLDLVPKIVSLRGLSELLSLGYCLEGRTPYSGVRILQAGEWLRIMNGAVHTARYWHWDQLPAHGLSYNMCLPKVRDLLLQAVERRAWRSSESICLLSGGLDSRLIAASLMMLGKRVTALNFPLMGQRSQDAAYAEEFARQSGIRLVATEPPDSAWTWSRLVREGLSSVSAADSVAAPRMVFSGEGGSVGLGAVYLSHETIRLAREGHVEQALSEAILPVIGISGRAVHKDVLSAIHRSVLESATKEITSLRTEPGRSYHLWLLNNDQRCHLHQFYEDIAQHEVEYLVPLFDGEVLEFILACPIDWFLRHRFYHDLLALYPDFVRVVPWQTYPGHLPCPVRPQGDYDSQFSPVNRKESLARGRHWLRAGWRSLFASSFPSPILDRKTVFAMAVLQQTGCSDYSYVHRAVGIAARYFGVAANRFTADLEAGIE